MLVFVAKITGRERARSGIPRSRSHLSLSPAKVRGLGGRALGRQLFSAALQVERRLQAIGGQFAQASSPSGMSNVYAVAGVLDRLPWSCLCPLR
jgi:hypothetical protein